MLPLRVLVADDHRLFRQGLIGLMKTRGDLVNVIGEASSGRETVRMTRDLKPDIVLMDIFMPDGDGLEATAYICEHFPDVKVVMLTSSEDEEHIYRAMQLGATSYLLKDLDADDLFTLLTSVAQGEVVMSREISARLLRYIARPSHDDALDEIKTLLTDREIEVLKLVAQGFSNPQIADELVISINTVKVHLRNILEKLRLDNRIQAAAYAVRSGLAPSEREDHPIG